MEFEFFISDLIRQQLTQDELEIIKNKFEIYKTQGDRQKYFGKDVSFSEPQRVIDAGLKHVHLQEKVKRPWNIKFLPIERSTSDTHLVYCQGFLIPISTC